jgi:predicted DNA-binding transcriptional regulator YafY
MDWRVVRFMTKFQYRLSDEAMSLKTKTEIVDKAIREKTKLEIIYLKSNDEKSRRRIRPERRGTMEYMGKTFEGLEAYCLERKESRVFRLDRILKIVG